MAGLTARYAQLEERIAGWAARRNDVHAAIVVGSRARADHSADAFSDLDVLLVVEHPQVYLDDVAWLDEIDAVWTWMTHRTVGGDPEQLVVFAGAARVDLVLVALERTRAIPDLPALPDVLSRGMRSLFDRDGWEARIRSVPAAERRPAPSTQAELSRAAREFWLLALYAAQQVARDDLWWVRACDDSLRAALLPVLAWHAQAMRGGITGHNGRQIAAWADRRVAAALPATWARYDRDDAWRALQATIALFRWTARETATALGLEYPRTLDARMSAAIAAVRPDSTSPVDPRRS